MLFNLMELVDMVIMTAFVGFIFKDLFTKESYSHYDPLRAMKKPWQGINYQNMIFAAAITAPAIILHEMGHKFVAMGFGAQATFHASYTWLALGLVLKLMNFGFIFFVPGYVAYSGIGLTALERMLIAGAGPFTNLAIWGIATVVSKNVRKLSANARKGWMLTARINLFLFFFNMLPIPPFDGSQVFRSLWQVLF